MRATYKVQRPFLRPVMYAVYTIRLILPFFRRSVGSGHSGATHSPPASSSGGSDSSYTSGGVAPVAGAAAATSATNQFADANTSQQALPVTTTIDASSSPSSSSKPKEVFEFTKRKRYADLLTTELTEAIILVLSLNGDVWYCGNAVQDLLGWRDDEVIDRKFSEFINGEGLPQRRGMLLTIPVCSVNMISGRPSKVPDHV